MYYHLQRLIAGILIILLLPLFPIVFLVIKLNSKGPTIFRQKRIGLHEKPFDMFKLRTMVENAEKIKDKYKSLNEAKGPVFKIRNDPRYTNFGKFLAHTALDEIPQLLNVVKGEMAFVGPRPLPIDEAMKVPDKYKLRFSVYPGLTSPWVIKGGHRLSFDQWMALDINYVQRKNIWYDVTIISSTIILLIRSFIHSND